MMPMPLQILARGQPCPIARCPLPHRDVARYGVNYTLLRMVESASGDASEAFRLREDQLVYNTDDASFLGRGGSGAVFRGACTLRSAAPPSTCDMSKLQVKAVQYLRCQQASAMAAVPSRPIPLAIAHA